MADTNQLTQTLEGAPPSIIARFEFEEARYPFLLSVSSLFYDLELAHDLGILVTYMAYDSYKFGQDFWTRTGRPLEAAQRLRTFEIVKQSPLALELIITAVGGIWALTQIIDKVANWKLNRNKLELEVAKLRQEKALKDLEILDRQLTLEEAIQKRDAERIYETLITRLNESELRLRDLTLRNARPSGRPRDLMV
jgi:hypothetical protein